MTSLAKEALMLRLTQFRLVAVMGSTVDTVVDIAVLRVVDRLVDSVHPSHLQALHLQTQLAPTLDKVYGASLCAHTQTSTGCHCAQLLH